MTPPQVRDWAPPLRQAPGAGALTERASSAADGSARRSPYVVAAAWGTLWRYAVLGSVLLAMVGGLGPPVIAGAVVGGAGALLGLWFRRGWVACLWRAVMLGWLTGLSSSTLLFPGVVIAALAVITIEPWVVARDRRRPAAGPRRARSPRAPDRAGPPGPGWPRAARRA